MLRLLAILLITGALYALAGAPGVIRPEAQRRAEVQAAQPEITRLETALRETPEALHAWAQLGRLHMEIGQYISSAEAYRRAVLLSGGEAGLILQYSKALVFAANGEVTDAAKRGLDRVLAQDARNPEARYFLALHALQQGDVPAAMQGMKALYRELPEDSPLKAIINRQIGRE